jgi:hypothetical protein
MFHLFLSQKISIKSAASFIRSRKKFSCSEASADDAVNKYNIVPNLGSDTFLLQSSFLTSENLN